MGYSSAAGIPYAVVMERTFIRRVYAWMTGGLVVTGLIALIVAAKVPIERIIESYPYLPLILFIAQIILVGSLIVAVGRMRPAMAGALFVGYSALNGLTLSLIFLVYTANSIALTFFVTAGTFGVMSAYGYFTKKDLTSIGHLCSMALFGIILAMLVNMFIGSARMQYVISMIGVLVFVGLTAYDTQKIKQIHAAGEEGTDADKKAAVIGALHLYLDFINLFMFLLMLMGGRRD